MIISSEDGRISLVNSQAEVMFGFRREELIGQNIRGLVPDWTAFSPLSLNIHAGVAGPSSPRELWAVRKNKQRYPVEISLSPLQTEEGLLLTSAIRDITERKKADEAIRELNTTLEQRVAERTQELVRSNEALRQSNDDLKQFAYAASHDLQEPLRMVALYSQMLQRKYASAADPETDQYVGFIVGGAKRMEMLLKDLLTYSQTGADVGPSQPVEFEPVMRKVLLNLQASIEQNDAIVSWESLPTVQAHEVRLVQLLQNIIGNAIKYRSKEPPKIRIAAERREADWLFLVEDNGIGIEPEYAPQIFGIFKRLHGQNYPGTGIGLAICQRIVERYNGRIWVESKPGEGSKFFFTLPLQASEPRDGAQADLANATEASVR
jgi:hypothetical protein